MVIVYLVKCRLLILLGIHLTLPEIWLLPWSRSLPCVKNTVRSVYAV
jgi:hypothetical protein